MFHIFSIIYFIAYLLSVTSFSTNFKAIKSRFGKYINMKWTFGGEMGSMSDLGAVGSEGEYYFHPQKQAKLKGPEIGKQKIIAIFPYNNVLVPGSLERLNIFEMKHRQLLTDTGDNSFGIAFFSQSMQRLALVGTLAKVKNQKLFDDGRVYALIEGGERFYIEEIISERPYIKARVRTFKDYSESPLLLDRLERTLFNELSVNFKYLEMLYPDQTYNLSSGILKHQPLPVNQDMRAVKLFDDNLEISRSSKFSFSIVDMLKSEPAIKLAMLQEHVTERRLARLKTVTEKAGNFLKEELKKQGKYPNSDIDRIRDEILKSQDLVTPTTSATSGKDVYSSVPENYVNGQWVQKPTFFD